MATDTIPLSRLGSDAPSRLPHRRRAAVGQERHADAEHNHHHLAIGRRQFGALLNFRGLQHVLINEIDVVLLFGVVAQELGYVGESVQGGYPDCEAKRRVSRNGTRWERIRIEFEYASRNFQSHGHDPEQCDLVVYWEHNWPECPLEVLELKSVTDRLDP